MRIEWQDFKPIQGCLVVGVYANQLHVNGNLALFSSEFILKIINPVTLEDWYWKLSWFEDEVGEDHLIINEQDTPEPLEYFVEPVLSNEYLVIGSLFNFNDNLIQKVRGYGLKEKDIEIFTTLLIEFEESYLLINTGPQIEIRYLKTKPSVEREVIFTYE